MAHWLIKSEPDVYSWEQFVKDRQTRWDGIRNYAARLHMRSMKKGDEVLFYHSGKATEIMGICTVLKEAYPDPTSDDPAWFAVDVKVLKKFSKPVTLQQIKAERKLANMALVRISRLSLQPVTDEEWNQILKMGGMAS